MTEQAKTKKSLLTVIIGRVLGGEGPIVFLRQEATKGENLLVGETALLAGAKNCRHSQHKRGV